MTAVIAHFSIAYPNGDKPFGSYMLVITKKGTENTAMVVHDARKDYFNGNLSTEDVSTIYKNAEAQNLAHTEAKLLLAKKQKDNIGVNNAPLPPVCYDEWFLFTTCTDPNTGGGGGGLSPEDQAELNSLMEQVKPESVEPELSSTFISLSPDENERTVGYEWSIARSPIGGYIVYSHKTGTHKKVGENWDPFRAL